MADTQPELTTEERLGVALGALTVLAECLVAIEEALQRGDLAIAAMTERLGGAAIAKAAPRIITLD